MPDLFDKPTDEELIDKIIAAHPPMTSRQLYEAFKKAHPVRAAAITDPMGADWARRKAERINARTGLPSAASFKGEDGVRVIVPEQLFTTKHYEEVIRDCAKSARHLLDRGRAWGARCADVHAVDIDVEQIIADALIDQDDEGGEL